MRRARLTAAGWDADLAVERVDGPPAPVRDQVVVAVEACGVCYRDLIDREGRFPFLRLPITPGHEAVGRVVAVGPQATEWRVGDRVASMHRDACGACDACREGQTSLCQRAASVLGLLVDGGYATHLVVPERALYAVPESLPAAEAAALHCTFGTAWRGLVHWGRLAAGQRALVTGANGGVGSAAVQIAARRGAEVVAVVRSPDHVAHCEAMGAHRVLVDGGGGFHKALGAALVDVALDCVGEPTFNASLRATRVGGVVVAVGNVVERRVELNLGRIIVHGLRIVGSSGATRDDMAAVLAAHAEAPFRVPVHACLPLEEADRAQRMVRAGGLHGRVVLVTGA